MRQNLYGNIEGIVLDFGYVNACTARVDVRYPTRQCGPPLARPRCAQAILRPRGQFRDHHRGAREHPTLASATVKLPLEQTFDSVLFHRMKDGLAFLRNVQDEQLRPSSIRLVDNDQFQFAQSLKPEKSWLGCATYRPSEDSVKKWYVLSILGFDATQMVACTVMLEGTPE
jgi:hypothetical protein